MVVGGAGFGVVGPDVIDRAGRPQESVERDKEPGGVIEGAFGVVRTAGRDLVDFPFPGKHEVRIKSLLKLYPKAGGAPVGLSEEEMVGSITHDAVGGAALELHRLPVIMESLFKVLEEKG